MTGHAFTIIKMSTATPSTREPTKAQETASSNNPSNPSTKDHRAPISFLDDTWTWSSPSTWPLSIRFLPFPIASIILFFAVYIQYFLHAPSALELCQQNFNYGLPMHKIEALATSLATHVLFPSIYCSIRFAPISRTILPSSEPHLNTGAHPSGCTCSPYR